MSRSDVHLLCKCLERDASLSVVNFSAPRNSVGLSDGRSVVRSVEREREIDFQSFFRYLEMSVHDENPMDRCIYRRRDQRTDKAAVRDE